MYSFLPKPDVGVARHRILDNKINDSKVFHMLGFILPFSSGRVIQNQ